MQLIKNIDLVQIPVKAGVDEYSFPRNVGWANKKVDKILLCAPMNNYNLLSPIDGQTFVYSRDDVKDLFFDVYSDKGDTIFYELHYENILYCNNHAVTINSKLNLQLCRIRFTTPPEKDGVLLLYVFWGTEDKDVEAPTRSKTIIVDIAANAKLNFRDLQYQFIHTDGKAVRGIQIWIPDNAPCYITLRDHELKHVLNSVCSIMCQPPVYIAGFSGKPSDAIQYTPIRFDSLDIDFDYSFIRNAQDVDNQIILTFEY